MDELDEALARSMADVDVEIARHAVIQAPDDMQLRCALARASHAALFSEAYRSGDMPVSCFRGRQIATGVAGAVLFRWAAAYEKKI